MEVFIAGNLAPDEPPGRAFFISYAHEDFEYVERLRKHLEHWALPFWSDSDMRWGESFPERILLQISCALAVIVVMSPAAEKSAWVQREILEGQRLDRDFLPILIEGDGLFLLAASHYSDRRDKSLPSDQEMLQLRSLVENSSAGLVIRPLRPETSPSRHQDVFRWQPTEVSLAKLRQCLAKEQWEYADIITANMLLAAADRIVNGWLRPEDANRIPSDLLDQINDAWSEFSFGRFGFRAQLLLHRSPPPGAQPGGQRDFFALSMALGWRDGQRRTTPKYSEFVKLWNYPTGFFPTYRNPQTEHLDGWYDRWLRSVMAIHLRLRAWSA